ncbi:MAG: D-glycero-beta-D-manno-heptose 1-phosphate adenylyltransferase [Candidatus Omnitrophica bacterium]|nr:D-glycero-beta-D-manno-heptose 1-phosphate adenylyltransferase [Candidatus Omnitrophota bacterium]MBU4478341.1 D-glycero-beta-D-manno-heptose 1-phosphate adenylyltransferase [Candidatus Omnitrophota bacterium]MCG2704264.1 D-glycero-beta-D-manno-heptose 1-phosphate adenylyltransferase [Candidatus Omnitrophota bacterium]
MTKSKIKRLPALLNTIGELRKKNKKIVFTNGCFDIIHYGHVQYLTEARKQGDVLIVALNSDRSVKKLKGDSRPIIPQKERAGVVAALANVDFVVIFDELTPLKLIKKIKPDILVKGADWSQGAIAGSDTVEKYGGKVIRARFLKGISTTSIIEKIAQKIRE